MQADLLNLVHWVEHYRVIFWWVGAFSILMFLGLLVGIPVMVVKLPSDFLLRLTTRPISRYRHPAARTIFIIVKHIFGIIFLIAGFAMLFLPGQGLITMVVGLSLLYFPGKRRLMLKIVRQRGVVRALNRLRARFDRTDLQIP